MASGGAGPGAGAGMEWHQFECSVKELKDLMALRQHEAYQHIQQHYGGVLEICRRLQTSPTEGTLQGSHSRTIPRIYLTFFLSRCSEHIKYAPQQ